MITRFIKFKLKKNKIYVYQEKKQDLEEETKDE